MRVKRVKAVSAPPPVCMGCYWEASAKRAQAQLSILRRELLKARVEKRVVHTKKSAANEEHEPISPKRPFSLPEDDAHQDVVDLIQGRMSNGR